MSSNEVLHLASDPRVLAALINLVRVLIERLPGKKK
jgi:hypothetical protein